VVPTAPLCVDYSLPFDLVVSRRLPVLVGWTSRGSMDGFGHANRSTCWCCWDGMLRLRVCRWHFWLACRRRHSSRALLHLPSLADTSFAAQHQPFSTYHTLVANIAFCSTLVCMLAVAAYGFFNELLISSSPPGVLHRRCVLLCCMLRRRAYWRCRLRLYYRGGSPHRTPFNNTGLFCDVPYFSASDYFALLLRRPSECLLQYLRRGGFVNGVYASMAEHDAIVAV